MERNPRVFRQAFSLVELLVVVAIMSVLMGLGVSALNLWRGQALSSAGNQIADLVTLARQNSVAKNTFTAIAIKTQNQAAYTAVCLLEYVRTDEGSSGQWKMLAPWTTLRDGLVFNPGGSNSFLSNGNTVPDNFPAQISFRGQAEATSSMAVQVYQPDGTLSAGQMLRLRLVEGVANGQGNAITLTRPAASGQPANYYDIVVVRDSGQIKVERL